ncbi:MAG: hypothetical protein ABIZ49_13890, partial [Opitutaceae bacterium]
LVKYRWLKNGAPVEGARYALKIDRLKPGDSGVYLSIVTIQHGEAETKPVAGGAILLTVIPKSELDGLK